MYFRPSRLRFIFIQCGFFIFILFLLWQIPIFIKKNLSFNRKSVQIFYWQEFPNENKFINKEERLAQIESIEKQRRTNPLNWTKIFQEIYRKKIKQLHQYDKNNFYKIVKHIPTADISQKTFEIFEETPVFQRPKFCSTSQIFHPQCPYQNCQWTCKKSSKNINNHRRANIFHHVDINPNEMIDKIQSRSINDIWILWIDEANRQLEHFNQYQFNWTISFRQDSEISIGTYGLLIPISSTNKSDSILTSTNPLENYIWINYRSRSKHALWFVSNCEPQNRLKYYHQLKHYFPIHAFGSCILNSDNQCKKNEQCELDQSHLALFYLAFESQSCKDYITEKFWRALYYGMIPIVLGPTKQSYLDLGIPDSAFIHTDDFQSAEQLGKYLHQIANDYILYRKYFQWINDYEIFYQTADLEAIRMCELCMRLNLQEKNQYRFYKDIHQWHRIGC